eukprot:TRINITY_DN53649_c0_g1_i2.p1 TRINITY_DN53649_c0_g1~~TRINITY_DN53649_c0_g1_i2.p1  ORF type:complete len:316 (+),score=31.09 TRINITY_DN53649_c0_g1_i2:92-1039(+)
MSFKCTTAAKATLLRILRLLNALLPRGVDAFEVVLLLFGRLCVTLALGLYIFSAISYFYFVIPLLVDQGASGTSVLGLTISGMFFLSNLLYNYSMAVVLDPGLPPMPEELPLDRHREIAGDAAAFQESRKPRTCQTCGRLKPPRTHHCSSCKRCVIKMDHHCPWINGCVGALNQRYFLNFLFWLATGCTFVFITGLPLCMDERTGRVRHLGTGGMVMIVEFLAACAGVCVYGFALWNWFLCLSNQTTNEFFANRGWMKRSKYDRGIAKNLELVFGTRSFCRALLPSWRPLPLEGEGVDELEGTELTEKAAAVMEV